MLRERRSLPPAARLEVGRFPELRRDRWSEVVAPGHLKVVYEMRPTDDGWRVYTRVGVEMSAHEGSAKTISAALLELDAWLTRELART